MSDQPQLATAFLSAYKRLLDECVRFKAAEVYFLKLQVAALKEEGSAKEAHDEFLKQLAPEYNLPRDYFFERSFVMLVASFEYFLQELVHVIVAIHPKKVGRVEFKLSEILDAGSTDELVRRGIEATLNSLMYKKPADYLTDVADLLSIDPFPLRENWTIFVEAKARRDLGVHNGWKCNDIYLRKVAEAGTTSNYAKGDRLFPPKGSYLDEVRRALSTLADMMMEAAFKKHGESLS